MKKFLLIGLVLATGLILLSSCTPVAHPLDGTWTVTSTDTVAGTDRILGDGTITLNYLASAFGVEAYTGTASFGGGAYDYIVEASDWTGWLGFGVTIEMNEASDADPDADHITLDDSAWTGGATLSGTYDGTGAYNGGAKDIGNGTFTATK